MEFTKTEIYGESQNGERIAANLCITSNDHTRWLERIGATSRAGTWAQNIPK